MQFETARALDAINRRFYAARAAEFSAVRDRPWPGWARVLAKLPAAQGPLRVLDVGCGNGRLGRYLSATVSSQRGLRYVGVDASEPLLEIAREQLPNDLQAELLRAELVTRCAQSELPRGPFDLIALFGLLHHIPGQENRRQLIQAALDRLAPGGLVALTWWRFGALERFRKRLVSWDEYAGRLPPGRDPELRLDQLEAGDHLLAWGPERDAERYCHVSSATERRDLLAELDACLLDEFSSDGPAPGMNLYWLLSRPDA